MPAPWTKMAGDLDQNPKIRDAGRNGRDVYLFLLRRNATIDASGSIPDSNVRVRYLAEQLMCSTAEAEEGVSRAVEANLISIGDGVVVIVGWDDEWGRRPLTEAERKRIQRSKSVRTTEDVSGQEKPCPDDVQSEKDSPECHVGERGERGEEESGKPDGLPIQVEVPVAPETTPAEEMASVACAEINRLTSARFDPDSEATAKLCRALVKAKHTVEEALLVIRDKHAEWSANAEMRKRLVPSTLLALANFEKYLDELRSRPRDSPRFRVVKTLA